MRNGPCLCGDPYCGSCGNPAAAEIEAAEEWAIEELAKAGLSAEEYRFVITLGISALAPARAMAIAAINAHKEIEAENKRWEEEAK